MNFISTAVYLLFFNISKIFRSQKFFYKTCSLLANFSLFLHIFLPSLTAIPAFAEEPTPTPVPTSIVENIPTGVNEVNTPEPTPTGVNEVNTPEPTIAPIITETSTVTPTTTPVVTETPTSTPETTVTPAILGQQNNTTGKIETAVIPNNMSRTDVLNPTIFTDKPDYHPAEIAIITGSGFLTNTEYFLHITSDNLDQVFRITSDANGEFTYSYQLENIYHPDYQVEIKDTPSSVIASTTFTDTAIRNFSTTISPTSVLRSTANSFTITVTNSNLSSGEKIHSIKIVIPTGFTINSSTTPFNASNSKEWVATNHTTYFDLEKNASGAELSPGEYLNFTFSATSPSTVASYEWTTSAYKGDNLNTTNPFTLTFSQPSVTVVADTTPPVCPDSTITSSSSGKYINGSTIYYSTLISTSGSFTVTEAATDSGSGIQNVLFPETVSSGVTDTSTPYSRAYNWISTSSFNNAVVITCRDNAGNSATSTLNVLRDDDYPTLTSVVLDDYTVKNGSTINITSDGADSGSGVGYCHAFWSTNNNINNLSGDIELGDLGTDCDGSFTVPSGAGTFYIKVRVGDNVGIYPNPRASSAITVDNTAPSTIDDTGFGGQTYLGSKTFTLTPTDSGSGVANTKYCLADSPATCTPNISGTSVTATCAGSSCTKWIFYYSTDNAGNIGATVHSYNFNIVNDLTPPVISKVITGTTGANGWYISDVTVTWTVTDNESTAVVDSGCGTQNFTSETTAATSSCSAHSLGGSSSDSVDLKIDKTYPSANLVVTVGTTGLNGWYTSDVTVATNCHDTISTIESYTSDQYQTVNTTGQVFNGQCTNTAGLSTSASPLNIKLDKTAPVITRLGSSPIDIEYGSTYSDAGATALDTVDGNLTSSIITVNSVNTSVLGIYTVTYSVDDASGNHAIQVTRTVNVVDTTKPIITLTGDNPVILQVHSDYTDAGATVSDNYDGGLTVVTVNSVNKDTVGSYTVTYNVTDTNGNVAIQVTRTVNVVDTIAPDKPSVSPPAGGYTSDQSVTLTSSDSGSGLDKIYYTLDGSDPDNTKTEYFGAIIVDKDMTIKAIAYDKAGNTSDILETVYGIAPKISLEASSSVTSTSATITWTTDDFSTSRVIYDIISHPVLGISPNYGYFNSTTEVDNLVKVTSHSVSLTGLTAGTTYYYRTISHGSPETVSDEKLLTALSTSTSSDSSSSSSSTSTSTVCNDTAPSLAPTDFKAVPEQNSVILSWSKPSTTFTYYLIAFSEDASAEKYGNPNIGGPDTLSYTVNNLSAGTKYYFKIRTGNGCAPGPFSIIVSATPTGQVLTNVNPVGFEENVLSAQTTDNPTSSVTPTSENHNILGVSKTNKGFNWWWLLLILPLYVVIRRILKNKRN